MKSHMQLLRMVLDDLGTMCCTSTSRDLEKITTRVKHEGWSFLTITLPNFCQDFERSLDRGFVSSTDFVGYKKSGYLPRIFSGFTSLIFDSQSGVLLDVPDDAAIYAVRQVTRLFSKVNLPCSDARVEAALSKYLETERSVRAYDKTASSSNQDDFANLAHRLFGYVFNRIDREIFAGELVPKHGPGSTADRLSGNRKFYQTEWTERLEGLFHASENIYPSWSHYLDRDSTPLPVEFLDPGAERPVRVITVPKTLKTPRIIAIEPTCMQYMQQGILESFLASFGKDRLLTKLIGFDDQVPNQDLAREGSLTASLATLDLSEASDRVSNQLVRRMVEPWYWLASAIDATRSRKADVPGHGVIRLAKYASMGSALCFPMEAMVFTTLVFLGIQRDLNTSLTDEDLQTYIGRVRIYGDDIIVPVEHVRSVVATLEDFGLLVNASKSFWTGKFRESCGKEYFDGSDVSVVKLRELLPTSRTDVREIVSSVSFRNQAYFAGLWKTARYMDDLLRRYIPMPQVAPTSPALGRHSFLGYDETQKQCPYLQKPLVRAYAVREDPPASFADGSAALLKFFLKRGDKPFADEKHLERSGRPKRVDIKLGWYSAY